MNQLEKLLHEWEEHRDVRHEDKMEMGSLFFPSGTAELHGWNELFKPLKKVYRPSGLRVHNDFNLYPSDSSGDCQEFAVFLALQSMKKPSKFLNFKEALEKMVQHGQGNCMGITKRMLLVSSVWDGMEFHRWNGNFRAMSKAGIEIRLALWTGNGWVESGLG